MLTYGALVGLLNFAEWHPEKSSWEHLQGREVSSPNLDLPKEGGPSWQPQQRAMLRVPQQTSWWQQFWNRWGIQANCRSLPAVIRNQENRRKSESCHLLLPAHPAMIPQILMIHLVRIIMTILSELPLHPSAPVSPSALGAILWRGTMLILRNFCRPMRSSLRTTKLKTRMKIMLSK